MSPIHALRVPGYDRDVGRALRSGVALRGTAFERFKAFYGVSRLRSLLARLYLFALIWFVDGEFF